jgi:hypothetical protein
VRELYEEVHDAGEQIVRAYLPVSLPPWRTLGEVEAMLADGAPGAGRGVGDDWLTVGGVYLQYGGHPEVAAGTRRRGRTRAGRDSPTSATTRRRIAPCAGWPRGTAGAWRPSG